MQTILQSEAKVRFQDCDPFNHLYSTRYLDYFLNAREDQLLAAYQLNVFQDMMEKGLVWVIAGSQICYLKPVLMGETVQIESQLIAFTPRTLAVEMRMWDESKAVLKSMMWTNFTYFNIQTQRTALHSDELTQLFETIHLPVEQKDFEERKKELIRQNR
ncbi:acyl-CoA thioesterase [Mucilaginibacter sp. HD30]